MGHPDVVYLVRRGEPNDKLRYSLRSLANIDHGRVWLIGYRPSWCRGVTHIETWEKPGRNKFRNVHEAMRLACEQPELSEDFLYFNDDFYTIWPITHVPMLHRGTIRSHLRKTLRQLEEDPHREVPAHRAGGLDSLRWLEEQGITEPLSYEVHTPMPIRKGDMLDTLKRADGVVPSFQRSLYGNLYGLGGHQIRDVKAERRDSDVPDGPFLSLKDKTWNGKAGRFVRATFREPSRYER